MRKKLKGLVIGLALVVSAVSLTACGKQASKNADTKTETESTKEVVIGTSNGSLCLAPLHIAIDNGYFEEEFKAAGISWRAEEIDTSQISELVASGKIDAGTQLAGVSD